MDTLVKDIPFVRRKRNSWEANKDVDFLTIKLNVKNKVKYWKDPVRVIDNGHSDSCTYLRKCKLEKLPIFVFPSIEYSRSLHTYGELWALVSLALKQNKAKKKEKINIIPFL